MRTDSSKLAAPCTLEIAFAPGLACGLIPSWMGRTRRTSPTVCTTSWPSFPADLISEYFRLLQPFPTLCLILFPGFPCRKCNLDVFVCSFYSPHSSARFVPGRGKNKSGQDIGLMELKSFIRQVIHLIPPVLLEVPVGGPAPAD